MAKTAVKVDYIFNWNNDYTQVLILQTYDNKTSFPIIIAEREAIGLIKELEGIEIKRPQTHDLFFSMMQAFGIHLEEVYIHECMEGIFYTKLVCSSKGRVIELDSRPSDAVILALKADVPVFIEDGILETFGISTAEMKNQMLQFDRDNEDTLYRKEKHTLENISDKNLKTLLDHAIKIEDFEMAAQIRDILKQRKTDY
jgi:bifunctional DNase/RNase